MIRIKPWIEAFRLRTLPLALASIFMGGFVAFSANHFKWNVFLLACLTTLFLQILSNLANDYGDSKSGVDNDKRVGPVRTVQSGQISLNAMKMGVIVLALLSFLSGVLLLLFAFNFNINIKLSLFLLMGFLAILAAIKYTIGKNPYGYWGFGDVMVFLFFGIVGVGGSYYLLAQTIDGLILLPAASVGFLSSAVLNLNNLRDVENDRNSRKNTLVVKMGVPFAKIYHFFLLFLPFLFLSSFVWYSIGFSWGYLFLLVMPFQVRNAVRVWKNNNPSLLDIELKKTALTALIIVLLFGIGINIGV